MTYALHNFEDAVVIGASTNAGRAATGGFTHVERITMMAGGAALGAVGGTFVAIALGQLNLWVVLLMSAGVLGLGLHFANCTLTDAAQRGAFGCATVSVAHIYSLLSWPVLSLYAPALTFAAPALGLVTLGLLASCWRGGPRAVYRLGAQGALVSGLAAYQGLLLAIGS